MTIVHKSVLQNYSAEQMFALVEDIEAYPSFLPWCDSVDVQRDVSRQTAIATLSLNFCGIQQSFTTSQYQCGANVHQNEAGKRANFEN